ncbi:MAG: DUF1156 domain-containing protein, partial [Planctomycetales bacterium]|nr:DUF1156 domain-containing protein [Planctomycetales bacterium]
MTEEYPIKSPRKLIEVALPLDVINRASAKEKSIRHGHPSTLHLWWARRPLAAARAVIFAQMVNDPGYQQGGGFKYGKNKKEAAKERKRLFDIMEELVLWENTNNESVLEKARAEIRRSWREVCQLNSDHPQAASLFDPDKLPSLHDPFAGGGSIPLEAQRLGLQAYATDLNPVAVLINKAMIEIPPKFTAQSPVNPDAQSDRSLVAREWNGAAGLAADVSYYGEWLRDEAERRIGDSYPPVEITAKMVAERPDLKPYQGKTLTVIAWLWARTVKSPNPAFSHVDVPLASTFILCNKKGREAYVQPIVDGDRYRFKVLFGPPPASAKTGTKLSRGCKFKCVISGSPIPEAHVKKAGMNGEMGATLLAIVAEGDRGRVYLSPDEYHRAKGQDIPVGEVASGIDVPIAKDKRAIWCLLYGFDRFDKLFTPRQLLALTTFSDIVHDLRQKIEADAISAGVLADSENLSNGGSGARAYADAVSVYLAFACSKASTRNCTQTGWYVDRESTMAAFSRQGIAMTWDFVEINPLLNGTGSIAATAKWVAKTIENSLGNAPVPGQACQISATSLASEPPFVISTDPPYYDNVGYADLSDFFYVWLRRTLRSTLPALFQTILVPKDEELIASPYRHSSASAAEEFFLDGMTDVMRRLAKRAYKSFPITIYYAFKQSETKSNEGTTSNTGWETFLSAVLRSGLSISGTWPIRTEQPHGLRAINANSLASSVVLVCNQREVDAPSTSRRAFIRELNKVLPEALDEMTRGVAGEQSPVAPVDLSQAIIGPGMAVFSKYSAVLEADGSPMTVRTALQLINRFLAEDDFDKDTQFCLHWFDEYGWKEGVFGQADVLARAKATAVGSLAEAGVVKSGGGKVRLLKWSEYPSDWNPAKDSRTPVWES